MLKYLLRNFKVFLCCQVLRTLKIIGCLTHNHVKICQYFVSRK